MFPSDRPRPFSWEPLWTSAFCHPWTPSHVAETASVLRVTVITWNPKKKTYMKMVSLQKSTAHPEIIWIYHWGWLSAGQTFFGFLYQFCGFVLACEATKITIPQCTWFVWLAEIRNDPRDTMNTARKIVIFGPLTCCILFLGQKWLTVISAASSKTMLPII